MTATPRHDTGAIFVQTVSDYPLVEAIHQNVVKHPILPDAASRAKLTDRKSAIFTEKYDDYLKLGIEEWKKSYIEHQALGKKAVLFVMVDDTRNCDDVGAYLQKICPELQNAVLVIHTKNNGEIAPQFFKRQDDGGYTYLYCQPVTPDEIALAEDERVSCPTYTIGNDGGVSNA